jgi:hypothetical protein
MIISFSKPNLFLGIRFENQRRKNIIFVLEVEPDD